MRFCPWYPLAEAERFAPSGKNVLQVRLASGLAPYPRGRSAMVCYELADDARASAAQLAGRWPQATLWCRHLIELDGEDLAAHFAKLVGEFVRRFGVEPRFPAESAEQ